MVSRGEVASPLLSTAPAVPAPYVLASFGEGPELPVAGVRPRTRQTQAACRAHVARVRKKDMMRIVTDDAVARSVVCASLSQGGIP